MLKSIRAKLLMFSLSFILFAVVPIIIAVNVQINKSSRETVAEIEEVTTDISSVNEMIDTIAAAVEEQSVRTKGIATNVSRAAQGIQEITENLTQTSSVANDIAEDISEVNPSVSLLSENSTQIDTSAASLGDLSAKLKESVTQFKV